MNPMRYRLKVDDIVQNVDEDHGCYGRIGKVYEVSSFTEVPMELRDKRQPLLYGVDYFHIPGHCVVMLHHQRRVLKFLGRNGVVYDQGT